MRSASRSAYSPACSYTLSNSSCSAMKLGPLTFQCACLACVTRSTASDRRSWRRLATCTRTFSGMSFFVLYMLDLPTSGENVGHRTKLDSSEWMVSYERNAPQGLGGMVGRGSVYRMP